MNKKECKKEKKERCSLLWQQCNSEPHGHRPYGNPTAKASQLKRVHPAITSPLNARQPGAPCNCVSRQAAITFKRAAFESPALSETQTGHAQVGDAQRLFTMTESLLFYF